jgi:glycosyltransferase involved in cell wall biosynthesis
MTGRPRRAVVVLGMHRSGTSAVTRLLTLAGATPPRELMPANPDNPQGYWESRRIARFNNRLLESAGTRWNDDAPIPETWFTAADRQADRVEAAAILTDEFGSAAELVLKDPRICRLLPFWRTVFDATEIEPFGLVVIRDPLEVARSLAARVHVPEFRPAAIPATSRGLLLWLRYVLDADRLSQDLPRHVVHYANLIADWRQALAAPFAACAIAAPDAEAAAAIDAFLDPSLRRQQANEQLPADVPAGGLELLRGICARLGHDAPDWQQLRDHTAATLDRLQAAYREARQQHDPFADRDPWSERILAGLLGPPRRRTAAASRPRAVFLSAAPRSIGHVYRVEHPAAALGEAGWQTAVLPLDDPAAAHGAAKADLVVVFRGQWGEPLARIRSACTAAGIPLVYDIDDLLFDPQVTAAGWVAFLDTLPPEDRARWIAAAADYRRALALADAALLTTPALATAAAEVCRSTHVLPNALDPRMEAAAAAARSIPKASAADGRPRLVFASGTPTHHRDFAVAAEAIAHVFDRRPEPVLVILGHLDPTIYPALAPYADRIEVRPPVPLLDLFAELARCDLNLCPLELGSPFNEAKSGVRWLAAAAVGLPSIVSPTEPLLDAVLDGVTGLVAADVSAWEAALDALLDDPARTTALGAAARIDALARFGFDAWSARTVETFASILEHHRRDRSGAPAS